MQVCLVYLIQNIVNTVKTKFYQLMGIYALSEKILSNKIRHLTGKN